jgi:acyl-CoA thioesterase-1
MNICKCIVTAAILCTFSACGGGGGGDETGSVTDPLALALKQCGTTEYTLRIMPLGDSITEAEEGHTSYRYGLWKNLVNAGCIANLVGSRLGVSKGFRDSPMATPSKTDFDQNHEGHWDYTADEVLSNLPGWYAANPADVVLLHLGSNDIFRGQGPENALADVANVIDFLQAANSRIVIFVARLIPSTSKVSQINAFNAQLDAVIPQKSSATQPVIIVDMNSGFSAATELYDGVHPNTSGEQKIADRFSNALLEFAASS